jgi:hypothetical protein
LLSTSNKNYKKYISITDSKKIIKYKIMKKLFIATAILFSTIIAPYFANAAKGDKNNLATADRNGDKNNLATADKNGDKNNLATADRNGDKNNLATADRNGDKNNLATADRNGDKNNLATADKF